MEPQTDTSLITACLAGDRDAWVQLIDRYERLIYSIPIRYGLSESQAADIFQDVCLILLEKLEHVRDESRLASWLGTVTRRECWKTMRRRDAAGPEDPLPILSLHPTSDSTPDAIIEEWEAQQALHHALDTIGERCQLLLTRLYFTTPTPSYEAIAAELAIPIGSVGPTRARCLKKLQFAMRGEHYRVEP